ncbi:MAG: hypothetical protein JSS20_15290 [Proteobacteria bacterium]|nr:hypothetical protein [Pseudomonadota bacterium]
MFRMIAAVIVLSATLVPGLAGAAPGKKPPPFSTPQDILRWINGYRARPEPQLLPDAVHAMSGLGIFRDLDSSGVYVGFTAGVIAANPDKSDNLIGRMFPLPPEDQVAIVRAIAYSGTPGWKGLLRKYSERMPARRVLIDRHIEDKLPTLATAPLSGQAANVDALWGFYFATGEPERIDRIIEILAWVRDKDDVEKLTTGSMAKWTLANNALQDKELLDHLKSEAARRKGAVKAELDEVIEAAETYETGKIRKQATASIEEIKRKGPDSARKLSFWGQAGQAALAVGCVAVSALGHPEVGVPCVIGGAASSAALKIFTPQ